MHAEHLTDDILYRGGGGSPGRVSAHSTDRRPGDMFTVTPAAPFGGENVHRVKCAIRHADRASELKGTVTPRTS